jgi:S1-C subfamily serine protease
MIAKSTENPETEATHGRPILRLALLALLLIAVPRGIQLAAQDLETAMEAMVRVRATIPQDATTAPTLGTSREGNGILIGSDGLILTIGYLILESDSIEVQTKAGIFQADFVAYDADTGFGLVRSGVLQRMTPMPLGESSRVEVGDSLHVAGFGDPAQPVRVISRGEFVGYWEYLLDNALYAAPAYPDFGGAALILEGKLVGVGSIFTSVELTGIGRVPCNMFVPIDLLKPILQQMIRTGSSGLPPRPWLGVTTSEIEGRVVVTRVTPGGPAAQAGLARGDVILEVGGQPVSGVAEFYRRVWSKGPAGVEVRLRVLQGSRIRNITVESADRNQRLKSSPSRPGGVAMIRS